MSSFLYFAFGSNLLKERLQLLNPSAVFVDVGMLEDYQLGFDWKADANAVDRDWRGCPATILPRAGHVVWGTVWRINNEDLPNLDDQEGVAGGVYEPVQVQVSTKQGEQVTCRAYQLLMTGNSEPLPSPHYLDVIIRGAIQSKLPADYIETLKKIEHNNYQGSSPLYDAVMEMVNKTKTSAS